MPSKKKSDGSTVNSNASLSELFSRLSLAASSNDYDEALSISNALLKLLPTDPHATKLKVIALIKLDKYKEALAFLNESASLDPKDTILERGFCLYKLGKGSDAEKVLEGSDRAILHVLAQNVHSLNSILLTIGIPHGGFCYCHEIVR